MWFIFFSNFYFLLEGQWAPLMCKVPPAAPSRYDEKARLFNPVLADLLSQVHLPTQGFRTTMYRLPTSPFPFF